MLFPSFSVLLSALARPSHRANDVAMSLIAAWRSSGTRPRRRGRGSWIGLPYFAGHGALISEVAVWLKRAAIAPLPDGEPCCCSSSGRWRAAAVGAVISEGVPYHAFSMAWAFMRPLPCTGSLHVIAALYRLWICAAPSTPRHAPATFVHFF